MDDFVNLVNRYWDKQNPIVLAAFTLWKLNQIHPFINGNGRTARAAAYLVLCLKYEQWLPGEVILPELLKRDRADYVAALKKTDQLSRAGDPNFLNELCVLLDKLLSEQLSAFDTNGTQPPEVIAPALPAPDPT